MAETQDEKAAAPQLDAANSTDEGKSPVYLRLGGSTLQLDIIKEWDTNHDGVLSEAEIFAAAMQHRDMRNKVRNYRNLLLFGFGVLLLSLGVMIAAVVIGIETTRTTKIVDGRLSTTGGNIIGTNQAHNFQPLLELFNTTKQEYHTIQFLTFWVPKINTVVHFNVEDIERNSTHLVLFSASGNSVDITSSAAYFQRANGERYFLTGTPVNSSGRRLSQVSVSLNGIAGNTGSTGSPTIDCCLPAPCCP